MTGQFALLPTSLPPGERILWQGRPDWRVLAVRGFHVRKLAVYFALLLIWYAATVFTSHQPPAGAALATLRMTAIALVPLLLICSYAWMASRATTYTITDRRVVLHGGIAMPVTFNLPFTRIVTAGLKLWPTGHGDIPLALAASERMAYLVVWPHARPWRMAHTEPMLRCIPQAERVAQILARALAVSADMAVPASPEGLGTSTAGRPHAPVLA